LKQSKILIVDDQIVVREAYGQILEGAGLVVCTADCYDQAITLLDDSIDLALIDIQLPEQSGLDILTYIRTEYPDCPVIMMSSHANKENTIEALRQGAVDFLEKPVNPHALVHSIQHWLDFRSLQQENQRLQDFEAVHRRLKQNKAQIRVASERLNFLLKSTAAVIYASDITDQYTITYISENIERLCGFDAKSFIDDPAFRMKCVHPDDLERVRHGLEYGLKQGSSSFEYRIQHKDGHYFWVGDEVRLEKNASGEHELLGFITDITKRKQIEKRLEHLSYYDTLTELPNRRLFSDRLEQALELAKREKHPLALLFLDLDRFKSINDSMGHACGDQVLKESARRLSSLLRSSDSSARMGGDEFAVLLPDSDSNNALRVAKKISDELQKPHLLNEQKIVLGVSVGIAIFPEDGDSPARLLMHADTAMYHAKNNTSHIHYYSSNMEEESRNQLTMEQDLAMASDENQLKLYFQSQHGISKDSKTSPFPLYYQTKNLLNDSSIIGVESLIRWQHPELGFISPAAFIPLAEKTGLIRPITHWVLAEAGRQAMVWEKSGIRPGKIAVNISAVQLMQQGLAEEILSHIRETGAKPEWIEIEVTETAAMRNPELAISIMRQLVEAGISIAIDDFGTGYSSLAYLKRLPAEWLKIDLTFIRGLPDDNEDAAIVRSTIVMAHALGMRTIAEGVETEAQLQFLKNEGCDAVQGYLFSKPMPADVATEYITHNIQSR